MFPLKIGDFQGPTVYLPEGNIWVWVKTLVPSEPQNSWDLWMFIPLKMVSIGIDPYPYHYHTKWGPRSIAKWRFIVDLPIENGDFP